MTDRRTITITIEVDLAAEAADTLHPVDGWAGGSPDDSQPPIPGALALGQWLAGAMAGDALTQIAPDLDPVIGLIRVTLGDRYTPDDAI